MPKIRDKVNFSEKLTESEVNQVLNAWDFLEFSNSYNNQYYNRGYLTPDIVNRQMQNINMTPVEATVGGIEQALKNPKDSQAILRSYAESFENSNMYYKRLIRYISDMALFNMTFDVKNLEKASDLKSKDYKEDLKILEDFCNNFNFKEEFQTVLRQMLRQGVFYCVLRREGQKYTLQELPSDYCMITGRHDYGLLFDFNMQWFIGNYGTDIYMYPKVFRKFYRDVFEAGKNKKYNPSKKVDTRDTSFVYWHQTSPADGFWAFKTAPELATLSPWFAPLFPEMAMQPIIRKLQEDKNMIEASKLLVGLIGMNKDNKSGTGSNQINITPDILGKFLGVARQGLAKQVGLTALPMEDIKAVDFNVSEKNLYTDVLDNIKYQSVSSSAALLDDGKQNVFQSRLAAAIDENTINSLYPMFANFVEYYVNQQTKKYKFKITFSDVNTPDSKSDRLNKFKDMAALGIVDYQNLARIFDQNIFELQRKLAISNSLNIGDNLIYLANGGVNQSAGNGEAKNPFSNGRGRPKIENPENENTANSQARGTNELKNYE